MSLKHLGIYSSSFLVDEFRHYSYFSEGSFGNFLIGVDFFLNQDLERLIKGRGGISKIIYLKKDNQFHQDKLFKDVFTRYGAGLVHFGEEEIFHPDFRLERWGIDYFHVDLLNIDNPFLTCVIYTFRERNILFLGDEIYFDDFEIIFPSREIELSIRKSLNLYIGKVDFVCASKVKSGPNIIPVTDEIFKRKFT